MYYFKYSVLLFFAVTLLSCGYFDVTSAMYEQPRDPPHMRRFDTTDKADIPKEYIDEYQQELADYIDYLEQYYVSIGLYYGADIQYPSRGKGIDECRVYDYIFTDIKLPVYPEIEGEDVDDTINELVDRILVLRKLIRENNEYMAKLRDHYKSCLQE